MGTKTLSNLPFTHDIVGATTAWAMSPQLAAGVYDRALVAADQYLFSGATPHALQAFKATKVRGEGLTRRGSVGIVDVRGAMVKRPSFLSRLFGMAAYSEVMQDFRAALDDREIKSIVLYVDSPGGEVNGADELASAIYAARGKKPITAFVSGQACSAAYWIASAASRVVVSDMALIGSIGVVLPVIQRSDAATSIKTFVSTQSPGKRMDVTTETGASAMQKLVNDLAAVFIKAVAKQRNVSTSTVVEKFGRGGVEIGAKAVRAGMVDAVGQFEDVVASLDKSARAAPATDRVPERSIAAPAPTKAKTETPALSRAVRERIAKIMQSPEGRANPTLAADLAAQSDLTADAAIAKLKAHKQAEIEASWKRVFDKHNNF